LALRLPEGARKADLRSFVGACNTAPELPQDAQVSPHIGGRSQKLPLLIAGASRLGGAMFAGAVAAQCPVTRAEVTVRTLRKNVYRTRTQAVRRAESRIGFQFGEAGTAFPAVVPDPISHAMTAWDVSMAQSP